MNSFQNLPELGNCMTSRSYVFLALSMGWFWRRRLHLHSKLFQIEGSNDVGKKKIKYFAFQTIYKPPTPTQFPVCLTPVIQLCVTKPVLLESECSMRQGHMGFLPTSSLPSSPSLEYIQPQPARQRKWAQDKGVMFLNGLLHLERGHKVPLVCHNVKIRHYYNLIINIISNYYTGTWVSTAVLQTNQVKRN